MAAPGLELRRMSRSEYEALPDDVHAEYVDGHAVMTPVPSWEHQAIVLRIFRWLDDAVEPPAAVAVGAGWETARGTVRIPDVMVVARPPDGPRLTEPPLVAVEVLSSNRSDDLVRKSTEYLDAGVQQYWVVDPRDRCLTIYDRGVGWVLSLQLDAEHPSGSVRLPGGATGSIAVEDVLD